jgi:hypothetical protein
MTQKNIIISVVVAVVIIVSGYFIYTSNKASETASSTTVGTNNGGTVGSNTTGGKKIAFSEFIKKGGSYKCTVYQSVGGATTEGVTYFSNGKIRSEYNTKVQGISVSTTLIVKDGYTYSWTSSAPTTGLKVKLASVSTGTGTSGSYSFNADKIGDYNCQPWTVDTTRFDLPTGVIFSEFNP